MRTASGIANFDKTEGIIAYGPYKDLPTGNYALTLHVNVTKDEGLSAELTALLVEIVNAGTVVDRHYISLGDLKDEIHSSVFSVLGTEEIGGLETRLFVLAPVSLEVRKLVIRNAEPHEQPNASPPFQIKKICYRSFLLCEMSSLKTTRSRSRSLFMDLRCTDPI